MASSTVVSVCNAPPPTINNTTISAAPTEPTLSAATAVSSMPGLSQLSTASGASVDLDDTYAPCDSTEGEFSGNSSSSNNNEYEPTQNQSRTTSSGTFWDLFLSFYLPVMLVWMRRSMFGTMNLFRSLIVGHCLRLMFGNTSEWMTEKAPWLQPLFFPQAASNGKVDLRSWPPPALTALAILTIVALVVHPDGCTWIVLGKIRDAMLSFFHSSTTCWGIIVSDYGLITTVAAAATFAALVLLIWIMHRTLSPRNKRPNRPIPSTEKKKKKRKGQMRHHHCRNGSGTGSGAANSSDTTRIKTPDCTSCSSSDKPLESPPSPNRLDTVTPILPCPPPSILEGYPLELSSTSESPSSPQIPALHSSLLTTTTATIPRGDSSSSVTNHEDSVHPLWASHERSRSRIHSVSTVDTSTMSDDQSCGSTSVRSSPSMSVTSSTLGSAEKGRASKSKDINSRDGSMNGTTNNSNSINPKSRRQQHKRGVGMSPPKLERTNHNNQATTDVPMVASSRWDALKPSAKHDHPNSSNHYHQNHHRSSGRGGGRGSRKGRSPTGARDGVVANGTNPSAAPAPESFFSLAPSPAVTKTTPLLTETNNLNHPVAQSAPVVSRSPSPNNAMAPLPSILTMPASNHYMPSTFPPPPPGLGPLPVVGGGGARLAMASSLLPTNSSLNGSHGLDLSSSMNLNLDWQNGAFSSLHSEMPFSAMDSILNAHRQAQLQHVTGTVTPNWMGCSDLQESGAPQKNQRQPILSSGFLGPHYSPLKENPFAPDDDSQIEADLQELGGRMAGSILDF